MTTAPVRRCTLLDDVAVVPATLDDWRALAPLHYRSHTVAGLDRPFALRWHGDLVGVILYCYPPANLAARNRALSPLVARLPRRGRVRFWNTHLRIISRVVIAPNWRGLGLAARLVRETLPQAGTPYVEALAAMGAVHPFFERAGMTRYDMPAPPQSERLAEALATAGITRRDARNAAALAEAVDRISDPAMRQWLVAELARWTRSYLGAKTARTVRATLEQSCGYAARFLFSRPVYYLWRRPATGSAT